MSTSPIAKLRAKDDERRQAKRNSLADKLPVEGQDRASVTTKGRQIETEVAPAR